MAVLAVTNPTLLDLARRTDPDGRIADIVEILNQTNEALQDITFVEGNLPTGHRTTIRSGIPAPTWRKINGGVQPTKSTTVQVTNNTGMLEAYAEVDKALADLNGNTAEWRMSEEAPFLEGINQELCQTMFYGNEGSAPEKFTGLSPYYNLKSAEVGDNIIDAGDSSGNLRSIWLVVWGPNTIHGIVPKGSKAGIQMEDKGQVTLESAPGGGGRMEAYRTHYRLDAGLVVRDWRYAVRIANINKAALKISPVRGTDVVLADLMFDAMSRIPNLSTGRAVFYMTRDVRTTLRQQLSAMTSSSTLSTDMVGGVMVESFQGIPIRRVDKLAVDETRVV
jgi:hypothetical protein